MSDAPIPPGYGGGTNLHIQEEPRTLPLRSPKALEEISKTGKGLMRHSGCAQGLDKVPIAVLDLSVYTKASIQVTILAIVSAIRDIANPW